MMLNVLNTLFKTLLQKPRGTRYFAPIFEQTKAALEMGAATTRNSSKTRMYEICQDCFEAVSAETARLSSVCSLDEKKIHYFSPDTNE